MTHRPRPRLSRGAAVLASVALVVGASGCSLFEDDPPTVMVVGDSVTRLSTEEIRAEMDWAGGVDIQAEDGQRTDELLPLAEEGAAAEPQIGVFMPGYNDILQETADTDALEQMVDIAAGLDCAVWMLLPSNGAYSGDQVELWNDRVRELTAEHDSITLSEDWRNLVDRSPDFTFVSETDAVHPSEEGQVAIAKVMSDQALEACT